MNTIPLENSLPHLPHAPDHLSKYERLQLLIESPMTIRVICQQVAEGVRLKAIADGEMVPYALLKEWIYTDAVRKDLYREAQKMYSDDLLYEAVKKSDDQFCRDENGDVLMDEAGQPVWADVRWAGLQVRTRLKVAQMLDTDRFVQAAKTDTPPLSDDGIAQVAKHLAGAFARRNLPGSEPHVPQDIEEVR